MRCGGDDQRAYYTCRRRCISGVDPAAGGCDPPAIPVDEADAAVREVLATSLSDPRQLHACLTAAQRQAQATSAPASERARAIEADLRRLEAERDRCYRALETADAGSPEETAAMARALEVKRQIAAAKQTREALGTTVIHLPTVITLDQVRALVDGISARFASDPTGFQSLVATLHAEHGLVVDILAADRVRVSLALDVGALGAAGGVRPRLVATATPRVPLAGEGGDPHLNVAAWVAAENARGHACACGCGERIAVQPLHHAKGIPRYIQGHHNRDCVKLRWARPDGGLTIGRAAQALGISVNGVRRMTERGTLRCTWEDVRGVQVRVYRPEDIEAARAVIAARR